MMALAKIWHQTKELKTYQYIPRSSLEKLEQRILATKKLKLRAFLTPPSPTDSLPGSVKC